MLSLNILADTVAPSLFYPLIMAVFSAFCLMAVGIFFIANRRCCKKSKKDDPESVLLKQRLAVEQKKMAKYKFAIPSADHPQFNPIFQQENNEIAKEVKESYKLIGNTSTLFCTDKKTTIMIQNLDLSSNNAKLENDLNFADNNISQKSSLPKDISLEHGKKSTRQEMQNSDKPIQNKNSDGNIGRKQYPHDKNAMFEQNELRNTSSRFKELFFNRWIERNSKHEVCEPSPAQSSNNLSYGEVDSILTSVSRMDSQRVQRLKETQFYRKILVPTDEYCESDLSDDSIETGVIDEIIAEKINKDEDHFNLTHDEIMQIVTSKSKENQHKSEKMKEGRHNDGSCLLNANSVEKDSAVLKDDRKNKEKKSDKKISVKRGDKESNYNKTKLKSERTKQSRCFNETLPLGLRTDTSLPQGSRAKLNALRYTEKCSESLFRVIKPSANCALDESNLTQSEFKTHSETTLEKSDSVVSQLNNDQSELRIEEYNNSELTLASSYFSRPNTLKLKRRNTDLEISLDSMNNNEIKSLKSTNKFNNDHSCSSSSSSSSTTSWKELSERQKANKSCSCSETTDHLTHDTQTTHEKTPKQSWIKRNKKETRLELNESTLSELKLNTTLSSLNSFTKKSSKFSRSKIVKTKRPKPPR